MALAVICLLFSTWSSFKNDNFNVSNSMQRSLKLHKSSSTVSSWIFVQTPSKASIPKSVTSPHMK